MVEPSQFDCAICQNLLLDPVVGPCGHDFCQSCLSRWRTASARSSVLTCPLCRVPIPCELGVCVRLRETIQLLFPDKVRERRIEVEERKSVAGGSSTQTLPQAQRSSADASANRAAALLPASTSGSSSYAAALLEMQRSMVRHASRAAAASVAPQSQSPSTAQLGAAAAAPQQQQQQSDTWMPPATLCFSLGWYDPAETRGRRSLGRRRRALVA